MTPEPDLSLIVPTHNRPHFLDKALQSVLDQDWTSWECIVVDDGSEPPVTIPSDDPRFRLVSHESARGPAAARNTGIRHSRGRYIGFLDDDDLVSPSRIRVAVEALDADEHANCHVGALERDPNPATIDVNKPGQVPTEEQVRTRTPSVGQLTLRRDIVKEFDVELRVGEDVEWWVRVEPNAVPVMSETVTYLVRLHDSQRPGVSDIARLDARLKAYRKNADDLPRWGAARARQQQRVASAAVVAERPGIACRFALAALVNRPSGLRWKLAARSIVSLFPRTNSRSARSD